METLPKTKNKPLKIRDILKRMGREDFGKYIQGNGEIFILRFLENCIDWKPIEIGKTQFANRLRGRILNTAKIINVDNSPYWIILNVAYRTEKYGTAKIADLVYKEEKQWTGEQFRTSANISWKFQDNEKVALDWATNKNIEEKRIHNLANETWSAWIIKERIKERIRAEWIKNAPERMKKEKAAREKKKVARQNRLDDELLRTFS